MVSIFILFSQNKMILCLAAAHESNFLTFVRPLLIKLAREAFLCAIQKFLPANIFCNFLFDLCSFINTYFNVRYSQF